MLQVKNFSLLSTALIALILLIVSSATLHAASVSLSWQPNTEPDLAGYKIYYDTNDSGDYQNILDVGNNSSYTFTNLMDGETYRVAITAYDLYNNESDFSPEITFITPEATAAEFKMEMGEVSINHAWLRVDYQQNFVDPVVVASPLSRNNENPAIVRIRNVDETGFEIRVQEWDYQNDDHGNESVSYLVMERGTYVLDDGTRLEAGSFNTDNADSFETFNFNQDYQVVPVIMASVTTTNENDAVVGRIQAVTQNSFQYRLQEEEDSDKIHTEENVMYIAWEPSQGTIDGVDFEVGNTDNDISTSGQEVYFNQNFTESPILLADMQGINEGDPANLRYLDKNTSQVTLMVCEETSKDDELEHNDEPAGYLAFATASVNNKNGIILWSNSYTGETSAWLINASGYAGSFNPGTESDTDWQIFGPGDFNGDGYADILWINEATNEMKIWFMDDTGFASELDLGSADLANYDLYGPADFNGDGTADLLWRQKTNGQMYFWFMDDTGHTDSQYIGTVNDFDYELYGPADCNGDGIADIIWRNSTTGTMFIWYMAATGIDHSVYLGTVADPDWVIETYGDFDGDGTADLLWRHHGTGLMSIWKLDNTGYIGSQHIGIISDLSWEIFGPGDFDGNGYDDIIWHNSGTGALVNWYLDADGCSGSAYLGTVADPDWVIRNR